MFPNGGVTRCTGGYFAGDHTAGIKPDSYLQIDAVGAFDFTGQLSSRILNFQRGPACPNGMILQCNWCSEQRHDAVAGELVYRAAVALHDRRRPREELGHDLAKSFDVDG